MMFTMLMFTMMMVMVSSGGVWQPIARNVWVALQWATSAPLSYDDYQDDDDNGGHDGDGDGGGDGESGGDDTMDGNDDDKDNTSDNKMIYNIYWAWYDFKSYISRATYFWYPTIYWIQERSAVTPQLIYVTTFTTNYLNSFLWFSIWVKVLH